MPVLKFWNPRTRRHEPVSGPIGIMGDAPGAHVARSTVQSIPTATTTPVSFDTVLRDSHGYWNPVSPTRLTVPPGQQGWYLVVTNGIFDSLGAQRWFSQPAKNGSQSIGGRVGAAVSGGGLLDNIGASLFIPAWLNAGDYVEQGVWHNSGVGENFGTAGISDGCASLALIKQAVGQPGPQGPKGPPHQMAGAEVTGNAQSLAETTYTDMTFASTTKDTGGVVVGNTLVVPVSGFYDVWAHCAYPAVDDQYRVLQALVNGNARVRAYYNVVNTLDCAVSIAGAPWLNAGDVVKFQAMRGGGGSSQAGTVQMVGAGIALLSGPKGDKGEPGSYGDSAWAVPSSLLNGWSNYDAVTFSPAGYRKDGQGIVHLRGLVKSGSLSVPIFILPAGYRPDRHLIFAVTAGNAYGDIRVTAFGDVYQDVGANSFVSLDGISFFAA